MNKVFNDDDYEMITGMTAAELDDRVMAAYLHGHIEAWREAAADLLRRALSAFEASKDLDADELRELAQRMRQHADSDEAAMKIYKARLGVE